MSSTFEFDYFKIPKKDPRTGKIKGDISRPLIPVRFSYGPMTRPFLGLIDSGADRNLIPGEIGELAGLKPKKKGTKVKIKGIGGSLLPAYRHSVNIILNGEKFKTSADFAYGHDLVLLGQRGFFDLFKKVVFNKKAGKIKIHLQ